MGDNTSECPTCLRHTLWHETDACSSRGLRPQDVVGDEPVSLECGWLYGPRVVQARTEHDDLLPQRVWVLRKGTSEAAIHLRAVPGIGAEIVLTIDDELRRSRLFRSHEQVELVGAIADTRAISKGKGWKWSRPSTRVRTGE